MEIYFDATAARDDATQRSFKQPLEAGEVEVSSTPGHFRVLGPNETAGSDKEVVLMGIDDELEDDCEACRYEREILEKMGKVVPKKNPKQTA